MKKNLTNIKNLLSTLKMSLSDYKTMVNKRVIHGKFPGTHFSRLPDVKSFSLGQKYLHPLLLESLSLNKVIRMPASVENLGNRKANKYIAFQLKRLEAARFCPVKFWSIANKLMFQSEALFLSALTHVVPHWYQEMSPVEINNLQKEVKAILQHHLVELNYKRVYVPKSNGKVRPVGVPTLDWRVALHVLNGILQIQTRVGLIDSQHGFIPQKGCMTAWREVLHKVVKAKFIYECDLSNFFNAIELKFMNKVLEDLGIPKETIDWIININKMAPKLPKEHQLDESYYERIGNLYASYKEAVRAGNLGDKAVADYNNLENYTGVAQGSPISPQLAILCLKEFLTQVPSVSYADDPLFYSDKDFEIQDFVERGLRINHEKSGWIKRDGIWLRPLKYLGLEIWLGDSPYLRGATRNGSTWELPQRMLSQLVKITQIDRLVMSNGIHNGSQWDILGKSNYFGQIMAWMYSHGPHHRVAPPIFKEVKPGSLIHIMTWGFPQQHDRKIWSSLSVKAWRNRNKRPL